MKKSILALFTAGALLVSANAEESAASANGLTLGLGFGYRNFHSTELKGSSNAGGTFVYNRDGSEYVGNATALPQEVKVVTVGAYSCGGNGNYSFEEQLAPVLSAAYTVWQDDALKLDLIANFQFYDIDTAVAPRGAASADAYYTVYRDNGIEILRPNGDYARIAVDDVAVPVSTGKAKFNLNMYVIDLGAKFNYTLCDNFDVFAATGPALMIADMESSNGIRHDNDVDGVFGWYVALGGQYMFTENVGLSLEARYDEVFDHVATNIASINLDSWSTIFKVLYQF